MVKYSKDVAVSVHHIMKVQGATKVKFHEF